jgi:hypothetical protein
MKTIIIKRELTEEQIITLATEKGWSSTIPTTKDVEEEITETSTIDGEEVSTTRTVTKTIKEDIVNPVSAEDFIGKYYLNMINKDAGSVFKELALQEMRLAIKAQEYAIENDVNTLIGNGTQVEII